MSDSRGLKGIENLEEMNLQNELNENDLKSFSYVKLKLLKAIAKKNKLFTGDDLFQAEDELSKFLEKYEITREEYDEFVLNLYRAEIQKRSERTFNNAA